MEEYTTWLWLGRLFAKIFRQSSLSIPNKAYGKSRSRTNTRMKIFWGLVEVERKSSKEHEWDNRLNQE